MGPAATPASISPKGSYVSLTAGDASPHLYDVTGHRLETGPEFRLFGQWLSGDTFVAVSGDDLVTCAITKAQYSSVTARDIAPHGEQLILSAN